MNTLPTLACLLTFSAAFASPLHSNAPRADNSISARCPDGAQFWFLGGIDDTLPPAFSANCKDASGNSARHFIKLDSVVRNQKGKLGEGLDGHFSTTCRDCRMGDDSETSLHCSCNVGGADAGVSTTELDLNTFLAVDDDGEITYMGKTYVPAGRYPTSVP